MENQKMEKAQYELYENAQRRIKQKKFLLLHFWVFVIGCVLMWILNTFIYNNLGFDWYILGMFLWLFLFLIHFVNVFIINRFMGKEWERKEREKLVALQQKKILKMSVEIEKEFQSEREKITQQLTQK